MESLGRGVGWGDGEGVLGGGGGSKVKAVFISKGFIPSLPVLVACARLSDNIVRTY